MPADTQTSLEKVQALPADWISEVEDFVDFLSTKARRQAALDRLLAIAPAIQAAGAPSITEEEILAEIDAARVVRRQRSVGADRSCYQRRAARVVVARPTASVVRGDLPAAERAIVHQCGASVGTGRRAEPPHGRPGDWR